MNGQLLEHPFESGFRNASLFSLLVLSCLASVFVSPALVAAVVLGILLMWTLFQRPVTALGAVLAVMPIHFLAIMVGKLYGFSQMDIISAFSKEIPLCLIFLILLKQNGFRATTPDWWLIAMLAFAVLRSCFGGIPGALRDDFGFVLPYAVGRVTILTVEQQFRWARWAVWIVAVIAVLGMIEVFFIGEAPRTLLYSTVTDEGGIPYTYHATAFTGLREASTMVGPIPFAALCMISLIIWWAYCRNPLPAGMIAAGLICAVSRSAALGTALATLILAFKLHQKRRFLMYAALAVALFLAAIPVLGIQDYLSVALEGQDESAQGHAGSVSTGWEHLVDYPLGTGPGSVGPRALARSESALNIETTYLSYAAQYGIATLICLVGFLVSAIHTVWRRKNLLGYTAAGILISFALMMMVLLVHDELRLNCWVWFPVGLAIRPATEARYQDA